MNYSLSTTDWAEAVSVILTSTSLLRPTSPRAIGIRQEPVSKYTAVTGVVKVIDKLQS